MSSFYSMMSKLQKKISSSRALFFIFILSFLPFILFLLCKVAYFISFKAINPVSLMPYFLFAFIKAAPLHINYSEKTRYPAGTPLHFFILFFFTINIQYMYYISCSFDIIYRPDFQDKKLRFDRHFIIPYISFNTRL